MIHLENTQIGSACNSAIGRGVEPSAENQILFRAARQSFGQFVFGVAASRHKKSTQVSSESILMLRCISTHVIGGIAKYAQRERIVEHFGIIQKLMSGAAKGNAHRRAAGG